MAMNVDPSIVIAVELPLLRIHPEYVPFWQWASLSVEVSNGY